MINVLRSTTNVRPAKTDKAELTTTPTGGIVRINTVACAALGYKIGSYVDVVDAGTPGKPAYYLTAGFAPSADGKTAGKGAKLGSATNKSGAALQFSSGNTYALLGGNAEKNVVFDVNTTADEDAKGNKYYALTANRVEAKSERKPSEKGGAKKVAAASSNGTANKAATPAPAKATAGK